MSACRHSFNLQVLTLVSHCVMCVAPIEGGNFGRGFDAA